MKKVTAVRNDKNRHFSYIHKWTNHPEFVEFNLHTHTDYEIYIFIKGNINFVVEGNSYKLLPYDILLIRGNELHQIFPHPDEEYERIVISISDSFFKEWKCENLKSIFFADRNKRFISAETARKNEIDDILERTEKYINQTSKQNDTVVKCAIIELLYTISTLSFTSAPAGQNNTVSEIISYINKNLAQPISLDELAEKFFLSKYYMCRIFKKSTGFTINQYITTKRILIVKQLYKSGINLSSASADAGFGSYTNFYKAYIKEFGISPKKNLKRK